MRLIRLVVITTFILFALLALSRSLGRAYPAPFAAWFTYADGTPCQMPCLFGIRPGVTAYRDVAPLLNAHPAVNRPGMRLAVETVGARLHTGAYDLIVAWYGSTTVTEIILSAAQPERFIKAAAIGDIMGLFDAPDMIEPDVFYLSGGRMIKQTINKLVYERCGVFVYLDERTLYSHLNFYDHIRYLVLVSDEKQAKYFDPFRRYLPWQGTSMLRYHDLPTRRIVRANLSTTPGKAGCPARR